MRIKVEKIKKIAVAMLTLGVFALILLGCSGFESPTASNASSHEYSDLWNPQAGDVIGGHEVPLVCEGYWEDAFGMSVNPFQVPPRTFRIGPEGGWFVFGFHSLFVPAGAVDDFVMITMSNGSATGMAIDCNPSPFHFNVPVTFFMSYRGTQYENMPDPPLRVWYMSPDGNLEEMPGHVDTNTQMVTGETDHFSRYIVG